MASKVSSDSSVPLQSASSPFDCITYLLVDASNRVVSNYTDMAANPSSLLTSPVGACFPVDFMGSLPYIVSVMDMDARLRLIFARDLSGLIDRKRANKLPKSMVLSITPKHLTLISSSASESYHFDLKNVVFGYRNNTEGNQHLALLIDGEEDYRFGVVLKCDKAKDIFGSLLEALMVCHGVDSITQPTKEPNPFDGIVSNVNVVNPRAKQVELLLNIEPWYHGHLSPDEAASLLLENGDFLVRCSPENPETILFMCIKKDGVCYDLPLVTGDGTLCIGGDEFGTDLGLLINHHYINDIPLVIGEEAFRMLSQIDN